MTQKYKFYIRKDGDNVEKDLEVDFEGLRYVKCEGLLDKGKRKNIYTESYSDSDELRVWQGDEVTREATDITFTFVFMGDNRQAVYEDFYNYVKNGKLTYYDTARNKEALMVLIEAYKPKEDNWKGSTPYIQADFKFKNLRGECKNKE